jgi:hypothetical protein
MASAADVPNVYDVVIDGKGYLLADSADVKAQYGYTRTFVERQNAQGDYGDQFQDFWLSVSQRDWSLGEQQHYFRSNDHDSVRRFWRGTSIDVSRPGQVSLRQANYLPSFAAAVSALGDGLPNVSGVFAATSTNLYRSSAVTTVDYGAHGLGVAPTTIAKDPEQTSGKVFVSAPTASAVRSVTNALTWATFSASPADSLIYLNNTLFGFRLTTSDLIRYNTAGAASVIFTWKTASGDPAYGSTGTVLKVFGGRLLICLGGANDRGVWMFDGSGVVKIMDAPFNFFVTAAEIIQGLLFLGGYLYAIGGNYPAIFYYANGTLGFLWKGDSSANTTDVKMAPYQEGLAFTDDIRDVIYWFNPSSGGGFHPDNFRRCRLVQNHGPRRRRIPAYPGRIGGNLLPEHQPGHQRNSHLIPLRLRLFPRQTLQRDQGVLHFRYVW